MCEMFFSTYKMTDDDFGDFVIDTAYDHGNATYLTGNKLIDKCDLLNLKYD